MDAFLNGSTAGVQAIVNLPCEDESVDDVIMADDQDSDIPTQWIDYGNDFVPAPTLKTKEKLPSGVYKVTYSRDDYHIIPIKINTDELYKFSEDFTDKILNEVNKFWERKEDYKKCKITHKRGLLLAGRPGTGKSAIINLLIDQLIKDDGIVFCINTIKEFQLYTDILKPIIRVLEPDRPIITIIEDIDQMIENIGSDAMILDLLDGRNSIEHHLVILTSNNTSTLSPALLRPSRIDMLFEVTAPSEIIRKEFFKRKGIPEGDINTFVKKTEGFTFAELKEVYTGTIALGKTLDEVVNQISSPMETKNYLESKHKMGI